MQKQLFAALMIAVATPAPAEAQVRDIAVAMGDKGEQLVRAYGLFNRQTCKTLAANITLQSAPTKGDLRISEASRTFPPNHEHCAGQPMVDTALHYTPKSGATGFDRIRLLETGGPTGPVERELVIYIRDRAKPNTAPPTRADIDHIFGPVVSYARFIEASKNTTVSAGPTSPPKTAVQPEMKVVAFGIPRDASGTFKTKAKIGGVEFDAIIDTGASFVALPHSLAKRLNLLNQPQSMKVPTATANGNMMATVIHLAAIEVGPYTEREVIAAIMPEGVEAPVLIGMSFLSRFKSVQMTDRVLVLMR